MENISYLKCLAHAASLLREGKLVAFPTETVYGLGANALDAEAVSSIFLAKGRPPSDPLIVHVLNTNEALKLIEVDDETLKIFEILANTFWPGPLTLIVKAVDIIPAAVTANTGYVGIRVPSHPIARDLLKECSLPIAAPSANRFGHISPTKAAHVISDLGDKGVYVLNGDTEDFHDSTCKHGIESTVAKINSSNKSINIFRLGAVTRQDIEDTLERNGLRWDVTVVQRDKSKSVTDNSTKNGETGTCKKETLHMGGGGNISLSRERLTENDIAPGQGLTHYAPDVRCFMLAGTLHRNAVLTPPCTDVDSSVLFTPEELRAAVLIDFKSRHQALSAAVLAYIDLSPSGSIEAAARELFGMLRWAESLSGASMILLPHLGVNAAEGDLTAGLQDRIYRAASGCYMMVYMD